MLATLPTGFGKSIIYHLLPKVLAHCGIRSDTVWIYPHAFVQICQENCSASARTLSSELYRMNVIDLKMTCDRGRKAARQEFVSGPPSPLQFFLLGEGEGGLIAGYWGTAESYQGNSIYINKEEMSYINPVSVPQALTEGKDIKWFGIHLSVANKTVHTK